MASPQFMKAKNKLIKEAIQAKEWCKVESIANQILSFDSSSYQTLVFLSLALSHLRPPEAEESYQRAITLSPSLPLARQGLASLYEKQSRWSDYAAALNELLALFSASQDGVKYAETLQKLLALRRTHGTPTELIDTLHLLLHSSPSYHLLQSLPPPNPTEPTATSYFTIQQLVQSPLKVLLELIPLISTIETAALEAEIKKRRTRLGGSSLSAAETRRAVEADQLWHSRLPLLYRAVLDDPDASDDEVLRRETEVKLLTHLRTLLKALPSSMDLPSLDLRTNAISTSEAKKEEEDQKKEIVRKDVEDLARGMVVVGVPEEAAWEIMLDWKDSLVLDTIEMDRFVERFPEHGLSKIYIATHDTDLTLSLPTTLTDLISAALLTSPNSLLAHLLSCNYFFTTKDWQSLSEVSEVALTLVSALQVEIGRELPSTKRKLETYLAISLVHLDPPSHHLKALRLLESLIISDIAADTSETKSLWDAKARVLQASESWDTALLAWDKVLSFTPIPSEPEASDPSSIEIDEVKQKEVESFNEVLGERNWCLFNLGEEYWEEAKEGLEKVVKSLEKRRERRDEEMKAAERKRSKEGVEKAEGVEEGEREEEKEERARAWWRFGSCLWELGATQPDLNVPSYDAFIASVLALPTYAPSFVSLGTYYESVDPQDLTRAFECYKKAFELDPTQEVAAKFLAEEFADEGEWSLVEAVARRVVAGSGGTSAVAAKQQRLSWAWKAIGGAELNSKKYPQAIVAFQSALRGSPTDPHTWTRLGVAYRESGKHVAALKVFTKALSLDPTMWYAQFSIAEVQRELGLLEPAVATFREIVQSRPDELGVRVILAETLLSKGREEFRGAFLVRAEESFVEGLVLGVGIIEKGVALRVGWKIVGDAMTGLGGIFDRVSGEVINSLLENVLSRLETVGVDSKIDGMDAITVKVLRKSVKSKIGSRGFSIGLATLAFKMRVLLETQNESTIGSAWLDLGISLSSLRPFLTSDLALPSSSATEALHQAVRCLKFALHKEPMNATFWNALGVLSFDLSPRLAQHSFIKSIEYNSRNAVPWANLGLFYLVQNDDDLANQAFLKAQVLDPEWGPAWVGQAALANLAGHAREAAVLLEHAFSLGGSTPQADLGYAESAFVAHRLEPTKSSAPAALSAPLFALTRYLAKRPEDVNALHLSALVLERLGDLDTAAETLEKVAQMLSDEYEATETPEAEAKFIISQTNLGRVRLAKMDHQGALDAFEGAVALLPLPSTRQGVGEVITQEDTMLLFTECRLGSSLAYYAKGDVAEAIEMLSEALDEIDQIPGNKSAALAVALCRLYWSEDDEDKALSALLDAPDIASHRSPAFVQHVSQALSTVTSDTAMMLTVDRIAARLEDVRFSLDFTNLRVLNRLYQNDEAGALSTVTRSLHAHPWDNMARRALSWLLIQLTPKPSATNPDLNENLEVGARFLRTGIVHEDFLAKLRSRRHVGGGIVAIGKGDEESEANGLMLIQKARFFAPWEKFPAEALDFTLKALA